MIFKKILLFAMFATAAGFCFADGNPTNPCGGPVQYNSNGDVIDTTGCDPDTAAHVAAIPVWTSADPAVNVEITGAAGLSNIHKNDDNIQIVSKIGADLAVENNINLGAGRYEFSGGANMLHPYQAPAGFNVYEQQSQMPLLHSEMIEDDGGAVLSMARSNKKMIYNNINIGQNGMMLSNGINGMAGVYANGGECNESGCMMSGVNSFGEFNSDSYAVEVDENSTDEVAPAGIKDQVRSWVVASGQTLRAVLQDWCDKEGWDLVWATPREYPIEASAVFKGRFTDVSSALVRNFGRATPVPYAKFYKGNRVLVISTNEGQ